MDIYTMTKELIGQSMDMKKVIVVVDSNKFHSFLHTSLIPTNLK